MATSYQYGDSLRIGPEGLDGAMWFHTPKSAVRLKGGHWIGYGAVDGFLDGNVKRLGSSADGSIWAIGSHQGQGAAARFSSGKWRVFTEVDGVIDDPQRMMATRDGGVWIKGWHQGKSALSHFDPDDEVEGAWKRVTSELAGRSTLHSYEASDGTLWFGSWGAGIYRYDGNSWMHFTEEDGWERGDLDGRNWTIAEWPTGTLWVGTAGGLYRIDLGGLPEKRVWWCRTSDDFDIFLPKFRNLTPTENALWFHPYAPRSAGAIRYDGTTWRTFTTDDGLPMML
jgi:ligand-binding sensor domain-containing protein